MLQLKVNGQRHEVAMEADTPLLWVLRDGLKLTGTKFGCGIAVCGVCVVLADVKPVRSCVTPVSAVTGKNITTIEGLSVDSSHAVQQAWIGEEVPQCGYCQSGQVQQRNFDDYPLLRLEECPLIDVHIIDSEQAPGGVGEPGVPPTAPAVANAVFALTGRPVRSLPVRLAG